MSGIPAGYDLNSRRLLATADALVKEWDEKRTSDAFWRLFEYLRIVVAAELRAEEEGRRAARQEPLLRPQAMFEKLRAQLLVTTPNRTSDGRPIVCDDRDESVFVTTGEARAGLSNGEPGRIRLVQLVFASADQKACLRTAELSGREEGVSSDLEWREELLDLDYSTAPRLISERFISKVLAAFS